MLQQDKLSDDVIATGVQHSVRGFIGWTAAELGTRLRFEGGGAQEKAFVAAIEGDRAHRAAASSRLRGADAVGAVGLGGLRTGARSSGGLVSLALFVATTIERSRKPVS